MRTAFLLSCRADNAVAVDSDLEYFRTHFVSQPMVNTWHPPELRVSLTSKPCKDAISWSLGVPVWSERACELLGPDLVGHVEFLPLIKIKKTQYFAVNVLTICDCLDEDTSEILRTDEGEILVISEFGLRNGPYPIIFKLPDYASLVFASRKLADLVIEHRLTNFKFEDPGVNNLALYVSGEDTNVVEGLA
ncbi:MAG TPA: hypothetical protein PKA27_15175 [Fimbriimonadaceae bacterium]|nr:hypothetical protein [Fimbriimonadaceae bacterium]